MSAEVPLIKSVMTPFPYSIGVEASVAEALEVLRDHRIRHLPVLERSDGEQLLVGLLCERDLRGVGPGARVRDVLPDRLDVVEMEEAVEAVAQRMADDPIDAVLVEKGGRVAGIFTTTDACALLAELLRERRGTGGDDAA